MARRQAQLPGARGDGFGRNRDVTDDLRHRNEERTRTPPDLGERMKIFLDTAEIEEIRTAARWGVLEGVTTNPTLFGKAKGGTYESILAEITRITTGPVSAEVVAEDAKGMLAQAREFKKIASN